MAARQAARLDEEDPLRGSRRERAVQHMFDRVARRYDLLNRLLTLGLDRGWRRRSVRALALQAPARVADLACGTGDFCTELRRSGLDPLGVDFAAEMLRHATTDAPLVRGDVLRLPLAAASLDGAVCGFALRNLSDLSAFYAELARVVRPGGRIALLEVAEPRHALLRWGHNLYFRRVVPLIGGLLSDRKAYRYLPDSVVLLPTAPELADQLQAAGFTNVEHRLLSTGIAQLFAATRTP